MTVQPDPLSSELEQFEAGLDDAAAAIGEAKRTSRGVRSARRRGRPYRDLLRRARPSDAAHAVITRLRPAVARLRRAEIAALRDEGATTTEIARQLGITHQRVSRILSTDPDR